ncbi:hypothetical protein F383_39090 [Gossypium arboreum]
MVISG